MNRIQEGTAPRERASGCETRFALGCIRLSPPEINVFVFGVFDAASRQLATLLDGVRVDLDFMPRCTRSTATLGEPEQGVVTKDLGFETSSRSATPEAVMPENKNISATCARLQLQRNAMHEDT